jgi:predicted O-methyltransferase YrrM
MPIIGKLVEMYRDEGIEICTGLGPVDFDDLPVAPFTRFIKNGSSMTEGLGIALQEVYLLESIASAYEPANILIIGNSLGWSTLALSLLLPDSRVVAMDAGIDENSLNGIDLTNRMATRKGLHNLRAIKGMSPQDVTAIVTSELDGRVDFAFIDGLHTNEQIVLDFQAISVEAAKDAVYLFHDVHLWNLHEGIRRIESLTGRTSQSLRATPSGMTLLYDPAQHPGLEEAVAPFAPSRQALALVKDEARHRRHYRRFKRKLRCNQAFMKGVNALCQLAGAKPYSLAPE